MSQCGNIYAYLADGNTLTPLEAFKMFGCLSLHSRAAELRARGIKIKCELIEVNGKHVGQYSLDQSAGLAS